MNNVILIWEIRNYLKSLLNQQVPSVFRVEISPNPAWPFRVSCSPSPVVRQWVAIWSANLLPAFFQAIPVFMVHPRLAVAAPRGTRVPGLISGRCPTNQENAWITANPLKALTLLQTLQVRNLLQTLQVRTLLQTLQVRTLLRVLRVLRVRIHPRNHQLGIPVPKHRTGRKEHAFAAYLIAMATVPSTHNIPWCKCYGWMETRIRTS